MNKLKLLAWIFTVGMIYLAGCKKEEHTTVTVTTADVKNISTTTATVGGDVEVVGTKAVTERGVCWSENHSPTVDGSKATDANGGTGTFTINISGLFNTTTYYVRAYAINNNVTTYGPEVSFDTSAPIELIVNGDFSSPSDASVTTVNATSPWKTDGADDGTVVGRSKEGTEFLVWDFQDAGSVYQTSGTVPTVETTYNISLSGRYDWTYWSDYSAKVAVKFSAYTGTDPKTRTVIGSSIVEYPFSDMGTAAWVGKTSTFTLSAAKATQYAGQNLVVEFKILNALDATGYTGYDDAQVWFSLDKLSVKQQ